MIQYFRRKRSLSKLVQLFIETCLEWSKDDCQEMGASLAYYALFSLFPIILVILSVFGLWVGPESSAYAQILAFSQENLPPSSYNIVAETLFKLNRTSTGAGIAGFSLLIFAASSFFSALDRDFDKIWKVKKAQRINRSFSTFAWTYVSRKFFSFLLVLSIVGIMLLSQIFNISTNILLRIIRSVSTQISFVHLDNILLIQGLQLGFSFLLLLGVITTTFKVLPSTHVRWRDVWMGATVTTVLFFILQELVSNSVIRLGVQFQSYGVLGSVMVLLLWFYIIGQIILFGGEMTYVCSRMFGKYR